METQAITANLAAETGQSDGNHRHDQTEQKSDDDSFKAG
jgi:hypothetical protein